MRNRKIIFELLRNNIQSAKYIFMVDGHISEFVCKYINKWRSNKNIEIIHNKLVTDDNKYYYIKNDYDCEKRMNEDIINGKKLMICSDSAKQILLIEQSLKSKYENIKILVYHGNSDDQQKKNLDKVNEIWINYDVVLTSPVILYGVNFTASHFHRIYGYYYGVIRPQGCYQQCKRVRNLIDKECYLHINTLKPKELLPESIDELSRYVFRNIDIVNDDIELLKSTYVNTFKLDVDDEFTDFYLHYLAERNKAHNNYLGEMVKYFTEFGGIFYMEGQKKKTDHAYIKQQKEIKNKLNEEAIKTLIQASEKLCKSNDNKDNKKSKSHFISKQSTLKDNIDNTVYENILQKTFKTGEDKNIMKAYRLMKTLKMDKLEYDFLKRLGNINNVDQLKVSFLYNADDAYKIKFIANNNKYTSNDIADIFKRIQLIKDFVKLYFSSGLFGEQDVEIFGGKHGALTEERQKFIDDNIKDIKYLFKIVRNKVEPKNDKGMIKWLEYLIQEFFCNMIDIIITENYKNINKKTTRIKIIKFNFNKYIDVENNFHVSLVKLHKI